MVRIERFANLITVASIAFFLFTVHLVLAQNNTTTNSTATVRTIDLPIFGEITIAGGIVSVVMFILGWIIGQSMKSGIKIGLILLVFIFVLYVFGFISHDIIAKIFTGVKELSGFAKHLQNNLGMGAGAMNLQMATFFAGLMFGLIKG